jgi:hypothetical protein
MYSDGETRQEFEITLIGRPIAGEPTINEEASDVAWFGLGLLNGLDIHPSMMRQIDAFRAGVRSHID